jgi:adenylate kinase family enzyme
MLPSEPKIFHGREPEVAGLVGLLHRKSPRIAILGPGGMGKTSLAKVVLHHTETTSIYGSNRYFIASESATTKVELTALIGAHLGLSPSKDLAAMVYNHFADSQACLLILDNLETAWEPAETRDEIEEFLSLLTNLEHLALLVCLYHLLVISSIHGQTDHNARCRKTRKSQLDSAMFPAISTLGPSCSSTSIY